MADFKVPNLCGASPEFNAIQTKFESMMTSATDGLEVDASALKATLDTDVTSLVADLKAMIPVLPALPNVNLQGQLTSLSSLIPGSGQYTRLLADITTKFGTELTASGFSLDTLVSDAATAITGAGNLCDAVPNFEVPAAGGAAVEKAIGVLQPALDSEKEEVSVQLANANFTAAKADVEATFTSYNEIGEEVPTEDIGPYRVAKETTKIAVSDNKGSVTTIEATTPKNSVGASTTVTTATTTKTETIKTSGGEVTERKRSNVSPVGSNGFTSRIRRIKEYILIDDVSGSIDSEFTLKNTPTSIGSVYGFDPNAKSGTKVGRWRYISNYDSDENIRRRGGGRLSIRQKSNPYDTYTLDGQTITVTSHVRDYDTDPKSGYMFRVKYKCLDNYDPNFAGPI